MPLMACQAGLPLREVVWQDSPITAAQIISRINQVQDALRAEGATGLYVYGSRARGDERPDSDLDVFIEYDPASSFSLLDLAGIKLILEDRLGIGVHITTRNSLHPMLKADIEKEAIRVF